MHADRDPEHGSQRDQVGTDMTVVERAVVGAPVGHHRIHILELAFAREVRHEIGGRPARIGAAGEQLKNICFFKMILLFFCPSIYLLSGQRMFVPAAAVFDYCNAVWKRFINDIRTSTVIPHGFVEKTKGDKTDVSF